MSTSHPHSGGPKDNRPFSSRMRVRYRCPNCGQTTQGVSHEINAEGWSIVWRDGSWFYLECAAPRYSDLIEQKAVTCPVEGCDDREMERSLE